MKPMQVKPPLEGQGEVFLYMEPFPQEAERLRFILGGIYAVAADGTEVPLTLSFGEFRPEDLKRQRLMASGRLPQGSYTGLSFVVKRALLKGEEGEGDLIVPEKSSKISFLFTVQREKAVVISMTFKYSESVRDGTSFYPSFSLVIPSRPLVTLKAFVSNRDSNTVTVFDKRTGRVASVIETGNGPGGIALDQRARRAYVALSEDDAIDVIDVDKGDTIYRMRLNTGDRPPELALTPDGSVLLSVNSGSDSVSIINPFTLIEMKRLTVGHRPTSILLDRTGRKAYVFNSFSNSISVIDVPNRAVSATFATEVGPLRGQFNRKGDRLFVFFERSPYLIVYDPFTFSVVKRVLVGSGVSALKVDTNNDLLYLGRRHDGMIEVYDPFSLMPMETFSVAGGVDYMTIDNEGNNLLAVLPGSKRLVIVSLISKKTMAEMDVGDNPYWTTVMGER
jgi:YVTN family beta-propeller protein